jgi:hypothetical protein
VLTRTLERREFLKRSALLIPAAWAGVNIIIPGPRRADGANIVAASAALADVQAAVNAAVDGDTVLIPNGTATWTGGITTTKQIIIRAQNYTATPGGTANRTVTITNSASRPLFQFTSGNNFHCGIGGIGFNESNFGSTSGVNHVRFTGTGSKIPFIFDCYLQVKNRFGNEPDIAIIGWLSQGGVMWNCRLEGVGGNSNGQCCPEGASVLINSPRAWTTTSTMGQLDVGGLVNVYIEDSTWKDFGQSPDIDDRGRVVVRHCVFDGVSGLTHGFTSTWGGRHFEYYNNQIAGTTSNRNIAGRAFWLRAGTGVFTDNISDLPYQGYGDAILLDIGDRTGTGPAYMIPRQPGCGHNGSTYVSDPIYIWNQTGSDAYTWGVSNGWDAYVQQGRDIFVNQGAKPGYAKFTYPHPLRAAFEGGGPEPTSPPSAPTGLKISNNRPGPWWVKYKPDVRAQALRMRV